MIRRSSLIAVEILMSLAAAVLIGLGVAWWRLSQGPVELNMIRQQVETELSHARAGRPVRIERVELAWSRSGGALELHAGGVTFRDNTGRVLSRFDDAHIELNALSLITGHISVEHADLSGGEMTFTRKLDGALELAFGPPGTPPDITVKPAQVNESLQQRVARLLDGLQAAFQPVGAGGRLQSLAVRGAKLAINDEEGGGQWRANSSSLEVARNGNALVLTASADLAGAGAAANRVAPARLRVTTDTGFQSAVIVFGAHNVLPRALFSPAALGPFAGLNAPLTADISVGLDRRSGVTRIEGEAELGRGTADMEGGRFSVDGGRVHGAYDLASDELTIDRINLAGIKTRVNGAIHVHQASAMLKGDPAHPAPFDVAMPALTLDAPGIFAEPIDFVNVQANGLINTGSRELRVVQLRANQASAKISAAGRLYWASAGNGDARLHAGVEMQAGLEGVTDTHTVLRFWPMRLGGGLRDYLAGSITGGAVSNVSANLDIRPSDLVAPAWRQEAVDVRFDLANADMRFLSTMSPVQGAHGHAVLRGNSFTINIDQARINDIPLTRGVVDIPHIKPHGSPLLITAHGEGDARHIVELLMQKPLDLHEKLPIDPATVTGRGVVNFHMERPLLPNVTMQDYRFNVDGHISDLAGTMTGKPVQLSQGQIDVRGDQRMIHISGPVRAGTSNVNVSWNEYLNRPGRASSEYQIGGDFDANDLVRLGYGLAGYTSGRLGVTVSGQGRGFDVDHANVALDLRNAAVDTPWHFWTKRAGQAATARFEIARENDGTLAFNNLDARSAGLVVQGRVRVARDSRIREMDIPRLTIDGRSDAHLYMTRAADNGLDVRVTGALFDGAPFMDGDHPHPVAGPPPNAAIANIAFNPPHMNAEPLVRASAMVDRLKLRGGATLADAHVNVTVQRNALAQVIAVGHTPGNKNFSLALGVRPDDPTGAFRLRAEDAGFATRALLGADNIVGGTMTADGDWRAGPPTLSHFTVHARDFQVVKLPAMARLLSSAGSLTGLVEMLNGDGIGFSALDAPITYTDGHVTIGETRLAGPSIGLTAVGSYDIDADRLHVDGTVVPSFGINSMLGAVPVLGDLLVSRRGEGVLGMTYAINGHVAAPRVGVNPLSALTPGILRRIFEPTQHAAPVAPQTSATPEPGRESANDNDETRTAALAPAPASGGAP